MPDFHAALERMLDQGDFIMGKEVLKIEDTVAKYIGVSHAISLNSGTDALLFALQALGIGPGDEVITTPFTFVATAEVIATVGATPVFVDIDEETLNIDPEKIAAAITEKTKAIIPVHIFGNPAEMDRIMDIAKPKGIAVIEDACQAMGSVYKGKKVGSIGTFGCFSFFPTKNLGCFGDGGMVVTNDEALAQKIKLLRSHGSSPQNKYFNIARGANSRLDTFQAAVLNIQYPLFEGWNQKRHQLAQAFSTELSSVGDLVLPAEDKPECFQVFHQYTVRTKRRDELKKHLEAKGVPTMVYYSLPLHLQPVFAYAKYKEGDLPIAEKATREVISLPFYPELSSEDRELIISAVKEFFI